MLVETDDWVFLRLCWVVSAVRLVLMTDMDSSFFFREDYFYFTAAQPNALVFSALVHVYAQYLQKSLT